MNRIVDKDIMDCPYCARELHFEDNGLKIRNCYHCFHDVTIATTRKGFKTLHKTGQSQNARNNKIDKVLYRDVIYTITDAELLKFNFMEEKISFEDFFEKSAHKEYIGLREIIVKKAYYIGITPTEIMNFFRANGSKLNLSSITNILRKNGNKIENERNGGYIQLFSSELD